MYFGNDSDIADLNIRELILNTGSTSSLSLIISIFCEQTTMDIF